MKKGHGRETGKKKCKQHTSDAILKRWRQQPKIELDGEEWSVVNASHRTSRHGRLSKKTAQSFCDLFSRKIVHMIAWSLSYLLKQPTFADNAFACATCRRNYKPLPFLFALRNVPSAYSLCISGPDDTISLCWQNKYWREMIKTKCPVIHLLTHSLIHPSIHPSIHPLTHSLSHSLTHSFIHSFIHCDFLFYRAPYKYSYLLTYYVY